MDWVDRGEITLYARDPMKDGPVVTQVVVKLKLWKSVPSKDLVKTIEGQVYAAYLAYNAWELAQVDYFNSLSVKDKYTTLQYIKYGDRLVNGILSRAAQPKDTASLFRNVLNQWKRESGWKEAWEDDDEFDNDGDRFYRFPLLAQYLGARVEKREERKAAHKLLSEANFDDAAGLESWYALARAMAADLQRIVLAAPRCTMPLYLWRGLSQRLARQSRNVFTGFLSCSYSPRKAASHARDARDGGTVLDIRMNPGLPAFLMPTIGPYGNEKEILLPPGTFFDVVEVGPQRLESAEMRLHVDGVYYRDHAPVTAVNISG